ncbi:MAG: polysaccharide biosynthesis/export family protein [Planctomycetaceae bacterium]
MTGLALTTRTLSARDDDTGGLWLRLLFGGVLWMLSGCAALTNPVAQGIPVRMVPEELLTPPHDQEVTIPLGWLRRPPTPEYRLAAGDVLGIYIDGVLGDRDHLPPVTIPEASGLPPAVGVPITVRDDGALPLPLVHSIDVDGMTVSEAEDAIVDAFAVKRKIVRAETERVLVSLIRPRHERILVIRQDDPDESLLADNTMGRIGAFRGLSSMTTTSTTQHQGTGTVIDLPAYENDLLTALTKTGGLPGAGALNEVVIQRAEEQVTDEDGRVVRRPGKTIRIPIRVNPGEPPPFQPEDIILKTGDIVFVEARLAEVYYTAGLLPAREMPLPRDIDITAIEAIVRAGGPIVNGGLHSNNISGQIVAKGIGHPSPSLLSVLRRSSDGRQVNIQVDLNRALQDPRENILIQPGDVLILQETPGEAFSRFVANVITLRAVTDLFASGASNSSAEAVLFGN